ncbi:MAG: hypothetical protein AAF533_06325 [Acidobacteriota bacterium]
MGAYRCERHRDRPKVGLLACSHVFDAFHRRGTLPSTRTWLREVTVDELDGLSVGQRVSCDDCRARIRELTDVPSRVATLDELGTFTDIEQGVSKGYPVCFHCMEEHWAEHGPAEPT